MRKTAAGEIGSRSTLTSVHDERQALQPARACCDCGAELRKRQQTRCEACRDAYNTREYRRRRLERKLFGPNGDEDEDLVPVVDNDDLADRRYSFDSERVTIWGVETTAEIAAALAADATRHLPTHVIAPSLHAPRRPR